MKLRENPDFHGLIEECGYIPVHVTGNMYGENWESLDKITKPFPDAPSLDATQPMLDKGYTVRTMYEEADKFFQNLGLLKMTKEVWEKSILERPNDDRKMVCHPHSYDMCKGKGSTDFRIKYCTEVNRQGLHWAHHEMGHIQYFQQYTNLSFVYRYGANLAFHEVR